MILVLGGVGLPHRLCCEEIHEGHGEYLTKAFEVRIAGMECPLLGDAVQHAEHDQARLMAQPDAPESARCGLEQFIEGIT